ncbi:Prephenate dehydratase-domain-containing protein [Crassisporium funariophilum]|nr:Prephenate dehydratase-domain-containing protein [Crassisporium funariophilum]
MTGSEKPKVAVLGPLGTYTHEAAFKAFGYDASYEERASISDVFDALSPKTPLGVVPQENSIFGTVIETYDFLRGSDAAFIRGEITIRVEHCLLTKKGVELAQVKRIMSHEQALGQCRDFISQYLPSAHLVKTPSTAAAAQALLDSPPDCAAICSRICATLFDGLEVLFTGIQNQQSNFTRFFVVAHTRQTTLPPVLKNNCQTKALIRLSSPLPPSTEARGPCAFDVTKYLKILDLSTSRIDRRPSLDSVAFRDIYFIEVIGCGKELLDSWTRDVEKGVARMRSLGGEVTLVGVW